MKTEFVVGDRIRLNENSATIRYIGQVAGYGAQIWVGVEWDEPERGKHDGVVKGTRYFQTVHPTGGSLVKIENIPEPLDLLAEIRSRYMEDVLENEEILLNKSNKKIELIGMEKTALKQSKIEKLINIVLDYRNVAKAPPPDTPNFVLCRELNLYGNLLYKWHTVKQILRFFPRVQELNLRKNRMIKFENDVELADDEKNENDLTFSDSCKKLVISECTLDERTISSILDRFPVVSDVVAFGNNFKCFHVSTDISKRITCLDLEENPLLRLDSIKGIFPNLINLNVSNCQISSIENLNGFPKLEILNLRRNPICDWKSVNALQSLNNLKKLLIDCKNLEVEKGINVFEVIIAKLTSLLDLNRFDISEVERRSAEIRYINKYGALRRKDENHSKDLERLIKLHGEPSIDSMKKGLEVVKFRIECGNRVETRSLPLGMNVQKIKDMLSRLFKITGCPNIRLYLSRMENNKQHRIELDNSLKELGHYSPSEDRDIIVVECN